MSPPLLKGGKKVWEIVAALRQKTGKLNLGGGRERDLISPPPPLPSSPKFSSFLPFPPQRRPSTPPTERERKQGVLIICISRLFLRTLRAAPQKDCPKCVWNGEDKSRRDFMINVNAFKNMLFKSPTSVEFFLRFLLSTPYILILPTLLRACKRNICPT